MDRRTLPAESQKIVNKKAVLHLFCNLVLVDVPDEMLGKDMDMPVSMWSIKAIVGLVCSLLVLLFFNIRLLLTVKRRTKLPGKNVARQRKTQMESKLSPDGCGTSAMALPSAEQTQQNAGDVQQVPYEKLHLMVQQSTDDELEEKPARGCCQGKQETFCDFKESAEE